MIGGSWPSWWRRWPGRPPRPPRWHRTGCWPEDSPARSWHNTSVKYIHDHIWSNHCWVTTCPSPIWETGKWNGWFLKKWELNVWLPTSNSFYVTLISDFRSHLFKNSAASSFIYFQESRLTRFNKYYLSTLSPPTWGQSPSQQQNLNFSHPCHFFPPAQPLWLDHSNQKPFEHDCHVSDLEQFIFAEREIEVMFIDSEQISR